MKISIIKDVLRDRPHAIAIFSDESFSVKGITEFGSSIISDIYSYEQYVNATLPEGFVATKFKSASGSMNEVISKIEANRSEATMIAMSSTAGQKWKSFIGRTSNMRKNGYRSPSGAVLNRFEQSDDKINAVDFKARLFENERQDSSIASIVKKSAALGFDERSNKLVNRDNDVFSKITSEKIIEMSNQGRLVRLMSEKLAIKPMTRRTKRRMRNISVPDGYENDQLTLTERKKTSIKSKIWKRNG